MANYKSKFDQLHESAFSRYTQGAGFLAGDVVKFKKNSRQFRAWFQSKAESVQKLVLAMIETPGNLRIGILKNEFPHAIGAHGASDNPAVMADIYVELSPANWAYPMTVPLDILEVIQPTDNTIGGPVPDNLKDKNRTQIKGGKKEKGKAKEVMADEVQRNLTTTNVKLPNGNKWDDTKVGGGNGQNMPKTGIRETVEEESDSLINAYDEILQEANEPGSVKKTVKLKIKRLADTNEYRVSYFENGRYSEDKSYYTTDKDDATATQGEMEKEARAQGHKVVTESFLHEDEFSKCNYERSPTNPNVVFVHFKDSVNSHIHEDEVPVSVTAEYTFSEPQPLNNFQEGWVLDNITATDEKGREITLNRQDLDYLTSRATDFINQFKETSTSESTMVDEALGQPKTYKVGNHTVVHTKTVTKGEDPTEMNTWQFDNGYTIVEFFGDYELKDPHGKRIKHVSKSNDLDRTLHTLGLPPISHIHDAIRQAQDAEMQNYDPDIERAEREAGWDPNP